MADIIASCILILSFAGMVFLAGRKLPALLLFPAGSRIRAKDVWVLVKEKARNSKRLRQATSPGFFAQAALSKARIFVLRTERGIAHLLETMRKKAQEKDSRFSTDYWKQLKKKNK